MNNIYHKKLLDDNDYQKSIFSFNFFQVAISLTNCKGDRHIKLTKKVLLRWENRCYV